MNVTPAYEQKSNPKIRKEKKEVMMRLCIA